MRSNPYRLLGLILSVAGAVLAPVFYFIVGSVPMAAAAMSAIIIGCTCLVLANARPYLSPEACRVLLKTGMENTAALLEELGLRSRAIYLPSQLRNGHPQALVPLGLNGDMLTIKEKLPGRLIVRYGPGQEDMAIAVTTAGTVSLELLGNKPGPTADEIESALNYILSGVLDIAGGARVSLTDSRVNIEINAAKMSYEDVWYYRCLGSPVASIGAAVASEALGKPVRIVEESSQAGQSHITLEVLP